MTQSRTPALTLGVKVNRLFDVYRRREEAEQSEHDVADSISRLIGKSVTVGEIRALRQDMGGAPDPELIEGLTRHFSVPPEYLNTTGARAQQLDTQLRLLAAARDAGVKRLALRGATFGAQKLHEMLDIVAESDKEETWNPVCHQRIEAR